ncbi:MAG: hypothetical protein ABIZ91_14470 [Gemmatimonadaceae bacterium]
MGQGHLQLAQTQAELGLTDSSLVSAHRALTRGEDSASVAAFALARGNALYRSATATPDRQELLGALRFLSFADSVRSSPQSSFLLGATAVAVAQGSAAEAPAVRSCDLARLAASLLPVARTKLAQGAEVAPDAARQYLDYVEQLASVVAQQVSSLCPDAPANARLTLAARPFRLPRPAHHA